MPYHPMPVPPIFQPEVAADAIVWAADHPGRRETWVGGTTAATLVANKVGSGLLDRHLARTGYRSQQSSEPARGGPSNLWQPVQADPGAHGRFDEVARSGSLQAWAARNRSRLGLAGLAAGAAAALVRVR